jgi:large subunit ribosomal protein L15
MKYNQLQTTRQKTIKRVGRGISAGQGKTAGRGTKGQKARTGKKLRPGFSGGSNPLTQQLPKLPGFKSYIPKAENVTTSKLNQLSKSKIDPYVLYEAHLISSPYIKIKLLYDKEISRKMTVELTNASQKAVESIEKSGGNFIKIAQLPRPPKNDKK